MQPSWLPNIQDRIAVTMLPSRVMWLTADPAWTADEDPGGVAAKYEKRQKRVKSAASCSISSWQSTSTNESTTAHFLHGLKCLRSFSISDTEKWKPKQNTSTQPAPPTYWIPASRPKRPVRSTSFKPWHGYASLGVAIRAHKKAQRNCKRRFQRSLSFGLLLCLGFGRFLHALFCTFLSCFLGCGFLLGDLLFRRLGGGFLDCFL